MKLFENGVGRPSNEVLRKRSIVKTSIVVGIIALVVALVGGVTLLFNENNTNELKGSVASNVSDNIFVDVKFPQGNFKKIPNYDNNIRYITDKVGSYEVTFTITNKSNEKISYENNNGIRGLVEPGKSVTNTIIIDMNDSLCSTIRHDISCANDFISIGSDDFYYSYKNVYFYLYENLSYTTGLDIINEDLSYSYYGNVDSVDSENYNGSAEKTYSNRFDVRSDLQNAVVNSYGKVNMKSYLVNASNNKYYYRWFTYKTNEISEKTNNYSRSCTTLKANSVKEFNTYLTLSKKNPARAGVVKIYDSKSSCQNDKYGVDDNNIISKSRIRLIKDDVSKYEDEEEITTTRRITTKTTTRRIPNKKTTTTRRTIIKRPSSISSFFKKIFDLLQKR